MKRVALSIAALVALSSLAACGEGETPAPETRLSPSEAPTPGPTEAPTDERPGPSDDPTKSAPIVPGEGKRYQDTARRVQELVRLLEGEEDAEPRNTDEANELAKLDSTTPLKFADYTVENAEEETGRFCLEAQNNTYLAVSYTRAELFMYLGDGACSYDKANASVVGDVLEDRWTVGGDLMGDFTPFDLLG